MTIRLKLTMAFIAVILVANSILSLFTVRHIGRVWLKEVQTRVSLDLNSARAAYNNRIERITGLLEAVSWKERLVSALLHDDRESLKHIAQRVYHLGRIDMLAVLGPDGRVRCRAHHPEAAGDDFSDNPAVAAAMERLEPVGGTIVLSGESLEREGADLAERARFTLLPTPAAKLTEDKLRTEGMVLAAAVPVLDSNGRLAGVLYGGDLLNRRYEIVDAIREEVFSGQVYEGKQIGTVTVFQGDLRISTNVQRKGGARAVGTRLSGTVYDKVLIEGGTWNDRAFVVNDWYITAYEPIRDPAGRIIGALYVGLLEAPFAHHQKMVVTVFLVMASATTLTSLALLLFVTELVLRPIRRIMAMSRRVIGGDLSARVGIRPPGEMGVLCKAIDAMADAVAQREQQLEQATRRQIGQSEKMASIGRLAAGIAHEINNPLTGILTFASLLRDKENLDAQDRQDLEVIVNETTRVGQIVRGLLDFARESPSMQEPLDVNEVIRRTMRLIRSQKLFHQITIAEELQAGIPPVNGDKNQLQQVLLNLSLNACEAMPNGGTLTISTSARDGNVLLKVADTGCGIKKEHLDQVFEPFFSTKPVGKGTGLGLSVSYGIVQQHGGSLEVQSEEGRGTVFTIALPSVEDGRADSADGEPTR